MVMQVFSGSAQLGHRTEMHTAARMLARAILADSQSDRGTTGRFDWQVTHGGAGLRQIDIGWADGSGLSLTRMDAQPALANLGP